MLKPPRQKPPRQKPRRRRPGGPCEPCSFLHHVFMQSTFGIGRFRWLVADTFTVRLRWVSFIKLGVLEDFDESTVWQLDMIYGRWWVTSVLLAKRGHSNFVGILEWEAKGKAKKEKAPKQEAEGTARNLKQGCHSHSHSLIIINRYYRRVFVFASYLYFSMYKEHFASKRSEDRTKPWNSRGWKKQATGPTAWGEVISDPSVESFFRAWNRAEAPNQCGM